MFFAGISKTLIGVLLIIFMIVEKKYEFLNFGKAALNLTSPIKRMDKMKQPMKTFMIMIEYTTAIIIGLFSGVSPFMGSTTLDTKKIDGNIEKLRQLSWFNKLYQDDKFHRLFFTHRKVRSYLQSSFRVNRIMKSKHAQEKFTSFLQKQVQLPTKD